MENVFVVSLLLAGLSVSVAQSVVTTPTTSTPAPTLPASGSSPARPATVSSLAVENSTSASLHGASTQSLPSAAPTDAPPPSSSEGAVSTEHSPVVLYSSLTPTTSENLTSSSTVRSLTLTTVSEGAPSVVDSSDLTSLGSLASSALASLSPPTHVTAVLRTTETAAALQQSTSYSQSSPAFALFPASSESGLDFGFSATLVFSSDRVTAAVIVTSTTTDVSSTTGLPSSAAVSSTSDVSSAADVSASAVLDSDVISSYAAVSESAGVQPTQASQMSSSTAPLLSPVSAASESASDIGATALGDVTSRSLSVTSSSSSSSSSSYTTTSASSSPTLTPTPTPTPTPTVVQWETPFSDSVVPDTGDATQHAGSSLSSDVLSVLGSTSSAADVRSSRAPTESVLAVRVTPAPSSASMGMVLSQSFLSSTKSPLLSSSSAWIEVDSTEMSNSEWPSPSSTEISGEEFVITTTAPTPTLTSPPASSVVATLAISSLPTLATASSSTLSIIPPATTSSQPRPTATATPTPPPATTPTTRATTAKARETGSQDARYLLTLTGDCHLILNNTEFFQRFLAGFHDLLVKHLNIARDRYRLGQISCGSVRVYVTFLQVSMPDFDVMLQSVIRNGGRGLSVPVWIDGHFATFDLSRAKHVPLAPAPDLRTYNIVTEVMDDVDIIVIIVACCVCGLLVAIGIAICVKECYRRKHAQSFNLLEVPHVSLKLEDFTLTRIPRPRTIYNDAGAASASTVALKGFSEGGEYHPPTTTAGVTTNGGSSSGGGMLHPSDMHLHVKQHSDGLIVGLTSSSSSGVCSHHGYSSGSGGNNTTAGQHRSNCSPNTSFSNGPAQQKKLPRGGPMTPPPSGDCCHPDSECQASERLLGNRCHGDVIDAGTMNPVFVDDHEEGGDGVVDDEGCCDDRQERMPK